MICPLCSNNNPTAIDETSLEKKYFHCAVCDLRFLDPAHHLSPEDEKSRYLEHNNDVTDPRYQAFVRPLYDVIRENVTSGSVGLDFGAGTGPVLAKLLEADSYLITCYDPYFWPNQDALKNSYDFIFACEVVEHLRAPREEFLRIRNLLKPGGVLAIMTLLFEPEIDFASWYYRRDPTHIVFYSKKTFAWIAETFGFSQPEFQNGRLICARLLS